MPSSRSFCQRKARASYGITIYDYRKYVKPDATAADVRAMSVDQAKAIYRKRYWDAQRCDEPCKLMRARSAMLFAMNCRRYTLETIRLALPHSGSRSVCWFTVATSAVPGRPRG